MFRLVGGLLYHVVTPDHAHHCTVVLRPCFSLQLVLQLAPAASACLPFDLTVLLV